MKHILNKIVCEVGTHPCDGNRSNTSGEGNLDTFAAQTTYAILIQQPHAGFLSTRHSVNYKDVHGLSNNKCGILILGLTLLITLEIVSLCLPLEKLCLSLHIA